MALYQGFVDHLFKFVQEAAYGDPGNGSWKPSLFEKWDKVIFWHVKRRVFR